MLPNPEGPRSRLSIQSFAERINRKKPCAGAHLIDIPRRSDQACAGRMVGRVPTDSNASNGCTAGVPGSDAPIGEAREPPSLGSGRTGRGKCGSDALLVEFAGAEGRDPAPIPGSGENSATHRSWALAAFGVSSAWPQDPATESGSPGRRSSLQTHPPPPFAPNGQNPHPEENSLESLLK